MKVSARENDEKTSIEIFLNYSVKGRDPLTMGYFVNGLLNK
jgi:hypothetical protein